MTKPTKDDRKVMLWNMTHKNEIIQEECPHLVVFNHHRTHYASFNTVYWRQVYTLHFGRVPINLHYQPSVYCIVQLKQLLLNAWMRSDKKVQAKTSILLSAVALFKTFRFGAFTRMTKNDHGENTTTSFLSTFKLNYKNSIYTWQ